MGLNNLVLLKPIEVHGFEGNEAVSLLTAKNALLDGLSETLFLEGGIVGRNLLDRSSIETEQLSMHTKTRQISSSSKVRLSYENSSTSATGIQGTLVDGRWSLLSSVRTTLYPSGKKD